MRFALEKGLSKLGRWLRFLGHKVEFIERTESVKDIPSGIDSVITTSRRFSEILKKHRIEHLLVPRDNWELQLFLVIKRYNLNTEPRMNVCVYCGEELVGVDPGMVKDRVPEGVLKYGSNFTLCPSCGAVFWRGSHFDRIKRKINTILKTYSSYNISP